MAKENIEFVVDAHVHCGKGYNFRSYSKEIRDTPIKSAVVFSLADDIYKKADKKFCNDKNWKEKRRKANKSILSLAKDKGIKIDIYPFKFLWNDFNREDLDEYSGVKWQRRDVDPGYQMGSPKRFIKLIEKLKERNIPIVFDDEPDNIIKFIKGWSKGINVIIPHLGFGGRNYDALKDAGIWSKENVYTDTSYASNISPSMEVIREHINNYGYKRILFGSDYPNSHPKEELEKISSLDISDEAKKAITSENILRLMDGVRNSKKSTS